MIIEDSDSSDYDDSPINSNLNENFEIDDEEEDEDLEGLVYFDIAINKKKIGRILFRLFDDIVPRTCRNFEQRS